MLSLAERIERRCQEGKRGGAVRLLQEAGEDLVRRFKEQVLQGIIERAVTGHLGRPRGGGGKRRLSPWSCAAQTGLQRPPSCSFDSTPPW